MILNSFVSTNSNVPPRLRRPAKTINWPDGAQNSELQAFFSNRSVTLQHIALSYKEQKPHKCPLQYNGKCKKKGFFPFCTIKVYRRSKGRVPLILNLVTRQWWVVTACLSCFTPRKEPWYPRNRRLVGPRHSLDILKKGKVSCPFQDSNSRLSSPQPVTILTALFQLLI